MSLRFFDFKALLNLVNVPHPTLKRMSVYTPTGSDLDSTTLAGAFVEVVRKLNEAEKTRNAANSSQAPKNNVAMSANFDTNSYDIAVTLPISESANTSGGIVSVPTDYLGGSYSAFVPGTGTAKSTTLQGATLEIAQKLSAAELAVTPETDRPTNIQVDISLETRIATITAQIPFTPSFGSAGEITLTALDYV
ncbi:hypothetical protein PseudUWO311_00590 [Pseudanabaena sp. UWO311]|uniref:hypothetical protein n=1 Tax=Pseudanabaena sp. UWO311 TaxID=2487337 RepID=UPI001158E3DC|nr:hypothetical protein [Pseudanabaena sp. UWO311]TYQ29428.1 hypothetical protein PseudUWO311_00590 [Pseudanabaena sp. UWO311]